LSSEQTSLASVCAIILACVKPSATDSIQRRPKKTKLRATLNECRWLYNTFLEERRDTFERTEEGVSLYSQHEQLPRLKKERESLKLVHSQVLQNVAVRLDLAFKAFFRRIKAGKNPGYPRFRGENRYDSFTYPQSGFRVEGNRIFLSKIGHVKAVIHRPLEGEAKTATVRRSRTGKWYVCFSCEVEPALLPVSDERVGVDVGLNSFAALSNGKKIPNPRFFRKEEKELARAGRRFSEAKKGTPERQKRRKVLSRIHERIREKRKDFAHQESRKLINRYGFLAVEDLSLNRMSKNHRLAKSIMDAAWGEFTEKLLYKAEYAGRGFVKINPAYTSQDCSRCGFRKVMPLCARMYECPSCGLLLDRDHNAALNILRVGLHSRGSEAAQEAVRFS
jgi:putative transposase